MKQTLTPQEEWNKVVKSAYLQIYKGAKGLLSSIEQEQLRQVMERDNKDNGAVDILHELVSPLLFLRLERHADNKLSIHYGYFQCDLATQFYPVTSAFIRSIYKLTSTTDGKINIEAAVRTDYVITETAELFEYMLDRNKHHTFKIVKYMGAASNRKPQLRVA